MKTVTRTQAAALGLLAALLLAVAWLTDRPAGPVMALAGGVVGWLVSRMAPSTAAAPEPAPTQPPNPVRPPPRIGASNSRFYATICAASCRPPC